MSVKRGSPPRRWRSRACKPWSISTAHDPCAAVEQEFGQGAGPRTDFQDRIGRIDVSRCDEFPHKIKIDEEVLPEAMLRCQVGRGQKLPNFG